MVMQLPVAQSVFVDKLLELYIVAAILRELNQPALFEPPNRLHAFGGLFDAERRGGDGVEGKAMLQRVGHVHHQVQRRKLAQDEDGAAVQDFIIEAEHIETHHEISALQVHEQLVHVFLAVNPVVPSRGVERHAHAHAHATDFIPAANFLGGLLRFEIEIYDVLRHAPAADLNLDRNLNLNLSATTT